MKRKQKSESVMTHDELLSEAQFVLRDGYHDHLSEAVANARNLLRGETYIVVCTDMGAYYLATRQLFATREEADRYAATVNESRRPLVVAGRWRQLRDPVQS